MKQAGVFSGITPGRILILALGVVFFVSGCQAVSDFKRAYDTAAIEWQQPDDGFGRKVVIVSSPCMHIPEGFMPGRNLSEMLLNRFIETLSSTCPDMILDVPVKGTAGSKDTEAPFARCHRFRKVGANAVVSCGIDAIEAVPRHKWFWQSINPFGRSARKALEEKYPTAFKVRIRFTAWSTFTAAQIYNRYLTEKFDPAYAGVDGNSNSGAIPGFMEALSKLSEKGSDALCDAVFNQVWAAYLIGDGPDGDFVVSAGSRIGLSVGTVLDVWSKGDVIQSGDGSRFVLPGEKTGSVKVVRVNPDTAVVVPVSGEPPAVGSVVLEQGFAF